MKRVYVASPYTNGDWGTNVRKAVEAAEELHQNGHVPFIPHTMTSIWSLLSKKDKSEWIDYDLKWLEVCDALVTPEGVSDGVHIEVRHAINRGIPVYNSVEAFIEDQ